MTGFMLGFFWLLVRIPLCLIFYGTPLLGFWLASSLAAYLGGPHYLAWTAGLFLFPILPGFWELYAWSHRRSDGKPFLTALDRLSLRTFAVGLVFLAVLLYLFPQTAFVSLSTRGDWMLDNVKDSRADTTRRVLFGAAGGIEWLYRATRNNPYKAHIDTKAQQLAQEATKEVAQQQEQEAVKLREQEAAQQDEKKSAQQDEKKSAQQDEKKSAQQDEKKSAQQDEQEAAGKPEKKWPWKGTATLHRAVSMMPAEVETSIESVARYIAKQEKDPILRIKALHDYVADRIAYDAESFYSGSYPNQDAETVFKERKSVCAGYANLLSALASAINEKIIVVSGDARDPDNGDKLTGSGHAWNAARIGNHWYLIDACWDAGYVSREKGFTKQYKIDYLLPPPEVMVQDHFPEGPNWQLLTQPLSLGEFLRQPMLRPSFQAADLTLIAPKRPRNEAGSEAFVIIRNPRNEWVMAGLEKDGRAVGYGSTPINSNTARLEFPLPDKGTYRLNMFANKNERAGEYAFVGSVDFVNR